MDPMGAWYFLSKKILIYLLTKNFGNPLFMKKFVIELILYLYQVKLKKLKPKPVKLLLRNYTDVENFPDGSI